MDHFGPVDHMSTDSGSRGSNTPTEDRIVSEPVTQPARPTGFYVGTAAYVGRALAEWAIVVGECNGFIDRRRDEGVLGLSDVEVPLLGVEGFRKIG
jgi:hypothetical protein